MPRAKNSAAAAASPTIITGNATAAAKKKAADKAAKPVKGFDDKPMHKPTRSGETVTVACKIPGGLRLRFHKKVERTVEIKGGHAGVVSWEADPDTADLVLTGPAAPFGMSAKVPVVGGCGLTVGVKKDLWDRWISENPRHPALVNRQIFAQETRDAIEGQAMEYKAEKSGLQRMVPDTDLRIDRRRKKDGTLAKDAAITTRSDED